MSRSILVVDDDDMLLRACSRTLSQGALVLTASTAHAANEIAESRQLDAVVIDLFLAAEDGINLIKQVRVQQPKAKLLMWSASVCIETTVAAMRAGADDVRQKPIHPRALLRWLDTGSWEAAEDPTTTPTLERVQWEYARRVVSECGGNISEAARRLGIERATLRRHLKKREPHQ